MAKVSKSILVGYNKCTSLAIKWLNILDSFRHKDERISFTEIDDIPENEIYHANKVTLDKFGENVAGEPTYNGNNVDTTIAQRDVYDGLDSNDNTISLSAKQGKILNDTKADKTAIGYVIIQNAKTTKATGNTDYTIFQLNDLFELHNQDGFFAGKIINVDVPIVLTTDLFTKSKISLSIRNPY
jgi:hypothetical protein